MVAATSTVAVSTPLKGMPVPPLVRMEGLTMTMYAIVKNVVIPPTTSARRLAAGAAWSASPVPDVTGMACRSRPITAESGGEDGLQISLRSRPGQVEVRIGQRIDQRADDVSAADGD